jgi:hypothetical protein
VFICLIDEWHQSLSRLDGNGRDLLIDFSGSFSGLLFLKLRTNNENFSYWWGYYMVVIQLKSCKTMRCLLLIIWFTVIRRRLLALFTGDLLIKEEINEVFQKSMMP